MRARRRYAHTRANSTPARHGHPPCSTPYTRVDGTRKRKRCTRRQTAHARPRVQGAATFRSGWRGTLFGSGLHKNVYSKLATIVTYPRLRRCTGAIVGVIVGETKTFRLCSSMSAVKREARRQLPSYTHMQLQKLMSRRWRSWCTACRRTSNPPPAKCRIERG